MALVFEYPRSFGLFDSFAPRFNRCSYDPFLQLVNAPRNVSKVQVKENKDSNGWTVKVSLPGIRYQEHIKIRYTKDSLKIVANDGYHKYSEKIALPKGVVDLDRISAQFENQVLTVLIPKIEKKQAEEKEIQVTKTEAQQLEEEEAKKKLEEKSKKMALFFKRLSGPSVSHSESETHNTLKFDFGEGVNKENINIEVFGNVLTVSVKVQEEQFQYNFKKSVSLPDNVKEDQVSASFEGTTLVVTYPKKEVKKPFKIAIADSNPTTTSETQPKTESLPASETTSTASYDNKEQEESKTTETDSVQETNTSEATPSELEPETSEATDELKEEESKTELGNFVQITEGEEN